MKILLLKTVKWLAVVCTLLVVILVLLIAPIDRTPLREQDFYKKSLAILDTLSIAKHRATSSTRVGWATANITPDYNMPMAGYRPRDSFESVHDSLYAKVLVWNNGSTTVALVSLDLLLFPPALRDRLNTVVDIQEFNFLYLSATHTHNALGGWDCSVAGQMAVGKYQNEWIISTADKIKKALQKAKASMVYSKMKYSETVADDLIENRLVKNGTTDGKIRSIFITRNDSTKACFFTFSAHATSISKDLKIISADYPAEVSKKLTQQGYTFTMYMAGMVASHRLKHRMEKDFELTAVVGAEISKRLVTSKKDIMQDSVRIDFAHMPISFGASQMRITKDWRVCSWAFNGALAPLKGELTMLRIGDLTLIGTPCDFSGELYTEFEVASSPLIITSFNGDYVGYITHDSHYETIDKAEVTNLNWVGPYYGQYFTDMIKILSKK
jgi:neutral ceramidase